MRAHDKECTEELLRVLRVPGPSGQEAAVVHHVLRRLAGKVPADTTIQVDSMGNIMVTVGTADKYPLLNAHLDTVQTIQGVVGFRPIMGTYQQYLEEKCTKYSTDLGLPGAQSSIVNPRVPPKQPKHAQDAQVIWNASFRSPLGGDDRAGVAVILCALRGLLGRDLPPFKALLNVQEETGCRGSSHTVQTYPHFFEDVVYSITMDRRGNSDLITSIHTKLCSDEFAEALCRDTALPYKPTTGMLADAMQIGKLVPNAVNMSVGYYEPHSPTEYIVVEDWLQVLHAVPALLRLPHNLQPKPVEKAYPVGGRFTGRTPPYWDHKIYETAKRWPLAKDPQPQKPLPERTNEQLLHDIRSAMWPEQWARFELGYNYLLPQSRITPNLLSTHDFFEELADFKDLVCCPACTGATFMIFEPKEHKDSPRGFTETFTCFECGAEFGTVQVAHMKEAEVAHLGEDSTCFPVMEGYFNGSA